MNRWLKAELGTDALQMALNQRQPQAGLIMHTDRGSQYVADRYLQLRHYHGITPSMSRKGNCWDNAGAESFFHTLKTEFVRKSVDRSLRPWQLASRQALLAG